ncbi:MAG TPA: GNAT family N-acetyltransferase [Methyloversatilis sp.]
MAITLGDWPALASGLQTVRRAVFVMEQGIPEHLEWDEHDATSVHALATLDGRAVGCGRLLPDGHIGRMAVLARMRGHGVGAALLDALVEEAQRCGMRTLQLHAQLHASGFYARAGFVADGQVFDEVGIPHQRMVRILTS